jgi:hypothetical protein
MNPREILEVVNSTIQDSGKLSLSSEHYIAKEASIDGADANVNLPLVESTPVSTVRAARHNTDFVDYVTDADGNRIGEVFDATFEMTFQISVWTARGSGNDSETLMSTVREVLRRREDVGPDEPFIDENGDSVDAVGQFQLINSEPDNDLSYSPNLYRTLQEAEIWFRDRIETTDPTIQVVDTPEDGDMTAGTGDTAIEYKA